MKLHARAVFVLAALGAPAALPAAEYRFDAPLCFVHAEVLHFGTSTLRLRFGPLEGSAALDMPAGRGRVALRIPLASLDSGVPVLDRRLREPDLFDTAAYPEAYYVGERFEFDGATLRAVRGELTVRGTSRPLTLHALRFGCRADADSGRERCGGDFEAELRRSDFGMNFGLPLVADRVRLRIQVEALRSD